MPKRFIRSFTGGIANRIDPQNLQENQSTIATDIDVQGFALEPGKSYDPGTAPDGHFYHRGEWINDKDALSFEEFGTSVIKTYDNQRPELIDVIEGTNTITPLGGPLPPQVKPTGSVVSEGTIGEREAVGSHVLIMDRFPTFERHGGANCTINSTEKTIAWKGIVPTPFEAGDKIRLYGSKENDSSVVFTVASIDSKTGVITVTEAITAETASAKRNVYAVRNENLDNASDTLTEWLDGSNANPFASVRVPFVHYHSNNLYWVEASYTGDPEVLQSYTVCVLNSSNNRFATSALTNVSGGARFHEGYFVCWDDTTVKIVTLDNTTLGVETHTTTSDNDFLNSSGISSKITGLVMQGGKIFYSQELTGTVNHPNAYSGDGDDLWIYNEKLKTQLLVCLTDGHTSGNGIEVYMKEDGKRVKKGSNNYVLSKDHAKIYATIYPVPSKEYVYIKKTGATPPDIFLIDAKKVTHHSSTGQWTSSHYNKKRKWNIWTQSSVERRQTVGHFRDTIVLTFDNGQQFRWKYAIYSTKSPWHGGSSWMDIAHGKGSYTEYGKNTSFPGIYNGTWVDPHGHNRGRGGLSFSKPSSSTYKTYSVSNENAATSLGTDNIVRKTTYPAKLTRLMGYASSTTQKFPNAGKFDIGLTKASFSGKTVMIDQNMAHAVRAGATITISNSRWNDGDYELKGASTGTLTFDHEFATENAYIAIKVKDYDGETQDYNFNFGLVQTQLSNYVLVKTGIKGVGIMGWKESTYQLFSKSTLTHTDDWGEVKVRHKDSEPFLDAIEPTVGSSTDPRVVYAYSKKLISVNGLNTSSKKSESFGSTPSFRLDSEMIVARSGNDLQIFTPTMSKLYAKEGEGSTGLGLQAGDVIKDAWHLTQGINDYIVVKRFDGSLHSILLGDTPSHALLNAPFDEPLYFTSTEFYGVKKNTSGEYTKARHITPFYSDDIGVGRYVYHLDGSNKIWGRISSKFTDRTEKDKFYLTVSWLDDMNIVGLSNSASRIGDGPITFDMSLGGVPNEDLSGWTGSYPDISFDSKVIRDVVFLSSEESNIPDDGAVDINTRITFTNHPRTNTEYFLIKDKDHFKLKKDHKTEAHQIIKGATTFQDFDSSEIGGSDLSGITTFSVGAARMYDSSGPNIDFYYKASFVDDHERESAACPPSAAIKGMDSLDDCVQVQFPYTFFDTAKTDNVKLLRIYRFGGNSSEFNHLKDIDITDVVNNVDTKKKHIRQFTLASHASNRFDNAPSGSHYPVMQIKGDKDPEADIGVDLKKYVNSVFELKASSATYDGKWRIVQIKEDTATTEASGYLINKSGGYAAKTTTAVIDTGTSAIPLGAKFKVGSDATVYEVTKAEEENATSLTFSPSSEASWSNDDAITWQIPVWDMQVATQDAHYDLNTSNNTLLWSGNAPNNFSLQAAKLTLSSFGYRDKQRTPEVSLLQPQEGLWPPLDFKANTKTPNTVELSGNPKHFKYIRSVNGIFFAGVGDTLRYSDFNNPHAWPLDAYQRLDNKITGILEHAGEGIVFTTTSVYRVRGTDPLNMVAFRVPDGKGVADGMENSIAEHAGMILWLHTDGLCAYAGGEVRVITKEFMNFTNLHKPSCVVVDGDYWVIQEKDPKGTARTGFVVKLDTSPIRVINTSIEGDNNHSGRFAFYSKDKGEGYVITGFDANGDPIGGAIGAADATTLEWQSKELDGGEPNITKALINLEVVYDCLSYQTGMSDIDGVQGNAELLELIGKGNLGEIDKDWRGDSQLLAIKNDYDLPDQSFDYQMGNLAAAGSETDRKTVAFNGHKLSVGDYVWGELIDEVSKVVSTTANAFVLDKEPLNSGTCQLWWGKLPIVSVYLDDQLSPVKQFVLPPITESAAPSDTQTVDLYLDELHECRLIVIKIEGAVRVKSLSYRMEPLELYQSNTLYHSADVFFRGKVDLRFNLDGSTIYRKVLDSGDSFKEKRVYLPASSFGQKIHYTNESRMGMVSSVNFNKLDLTAQQVEGYA